MSEENRRDFKESLKRGLLIGASVGVLGGIFFMKDIIGGLILGLVAGFFAVLTRRAIDKRLGR